MTETWPETTAALKRLKRSARMWLTLCVLDWAAKSLGKMGMLELQIIVMRVIVETR